MSKQRRYESELDIRLAIAKKRRSYTRAMKNAEEMDTIIAHHIKEASNETLTVGERGYHLDEARELKRKCRKQQRMALLIEENHIPSLVRTLADFKTQTFAFMPDPAVVQAP
jgi:hypothetical protein